jgi:hypothetical protein
VVIVVSPKGDYFSFEMAQLRPQDIGVSEQVTFKIPVEGGSELMFMVPANYAEKLVARAAAARMSTTEYLLQILEREMQNPAPAAPTIINYGHISYGMLGSIGKIEFPIQRQDNPPGQDCDESV